MYYEGRLKHKIHGTATATCTAHLPGTQLITAHEALQPHSHTAVSEYRPISTRLCSPPPFTHKVHATHSIDPAEEMHMHGDTLTMRLTTSGTQAAAAGTGGNSYTARKRDRSVSRARAAATDPTVNFSKMVCAQHPRHLSGPCASIKQCALGPPCKAGPARSHATRTMGGNACMRHGTSPPCCSSPRRCTAHPPHRPLWRWSTL